jgi:hypothetical protein
MRWRTGASRAASQRASLEADALPLEAAALSLGSCLSMPIVVKINGKWVETAPPVRMVR